MVAGIWSERPEKRSVCAVIVTYHPDARFSERAARIAAQAGSMVIIDNGSSDVTLAMLRLTCSQLGGHLIANGGNRGVAAALNQGLNYARDQGFSWALTLDQDSLVDDRMLAAMQAAYDSFLPKDRIAIIGSNYRDENPRRPPLRFISTVPGQAIEQDFVITSGSLMCIAAYTAIGPFWDELFIDLVDMEYCFRARSLGFRVIVTADVLMWHPIGIPTVHHFAGREFRPTNHPAWRRYFMVRNYMLLVRRYVRQEPSWALSHLYSILISVVIICLFEEERLKTIRYMAVGLKDGLLNNLRRGPYRESTIGQLVNKR